MWNIKEEKKMERRSNTPKKVVSNACVSEETSDASLFILPECLKKLNFSVEKGIFFVNVKHKRLLTVSNTEKNLNSLNNILCNGTRLIERFIVL